jgi:molybdopterin synthase sulfur carrier subunit
MLMSIKVRYFASLKESVGRSEDNLAFTGLSTVIEVWNRANPDRSLPANILTAVNMNYVELDSKVKDGDEVAFFPPVTGG